MTGAGTGRYVEQTTEVPPNLCVERPRGGKKSRFGVPFLGSTLRSS